MTSYGACETDLCCRRTHQRTWHSCLLCRSVTATTHLKEALSNREAASPEAAAFPAGDPWGVAALRLKADTGALNLSLKVLNNHCESFTELSLFDREDSPSSSALLYVHLSRMSDCRIEQSPSAVSHTTALRIEKLTVGHAGWRSSWQREDPWRGARRRRQRRCRCARGCWPACGAAPTGEGLMQNGMGA